LRAVVGRLLRGMCSVVRTALLASGPQPPPSAATVAHGCRRARGMHHGGRLPPRDDDGGQRWPGRWGGWAHGTASAADGTRRRSHSKPPARQRPRALPRGGAAGSAPADARARGMQRLAARGLRRPLLRGRARAQRPANRRARKKDRPQQRQLRRRRRLPQQPSATADHTPSGAAAWEELEQLAPSWCVAAVAANPQTTLLPDDRRSLQLVLWTETGGVEEPWY
jgi:hypothetical protein